MVSGAPGWGGGGDTKGARTGGLWLRDAAHVKTRPPIPAHRQHPFSPGVHRLKRKGQFTYQTTNPANQAGRSEVWEARDCDSTQEMS